MPIDDVPPDLPRNVFAAMTDRLGFQLHGADVRAMAALSAGLAPLALTPARATALAYVTDHEGCDQIALGRVLGINRASTMKLVDALVAVSAVERRAGRDRRSNALHLGDDGARLCAAAFDVATDHDRQLTATLTAAEAHTLRYLLGRLHPSAAESGQ